MISFNLLPVRPVLLVALLVCIPFQRSYGQASPAPQRFPQAASKKGLLVEWDADVAELGIKHATVNLDLTRLIDPHYADDSLTWEHDGHRYAFRRSRLQQAERRIKQLTEQGILVYVILLAYQSADTDANRLMLHGSCATPAPNRICAFNIETDEGRRWFRATLDFLAARWSTTSDVTASPHGRVVGYILGNEVNSHWWWCNQGEVPMAQFVRYYADLARVAHEAIRRHSTWARLYVSLDHHWGVRYSAGNENQTFAGKEFIDHFAAAVREDGDFDWHLAYHPYPENLFDPRFWEDATATADEDTPRITFKNLEVLTQYFLKPRLRYRQHPRSIILSEQGFHSAEGEDGERMQAAAFCLAYKEVESLEGIDAFILHRHVDHPNEGGLHLGLRGLPQAESEERPKKLIYECFRKADTPEWRDAFDFALPIVGLPAW